MRPHDPTRRTRIGAVRDADFAVLVLSSIQRKGTHDPEGLIGGVRVCESIVESLERKMTASGQRELEPDIETARRMKKVIEDLKLDPMSHSHDEIEAVKRYLLEMTMSTWRSHNTQFRQRELRWSGTEDEQLP